MSKKQAPVGQAANAIEAEIAWIDKAPIHEAVTAVMRLANTIDTSRTAVVEAKRRVIQRACADGVSVRRVAEMMKVSPGYVQRLKTQR